MKVLAGLKRINTVARAFPEILFYADDAIFIKNIHSDSSDKRLLSAKIRNKAHVMEQDIYIIGKPRFKFLETELESLLNEWNEKFPKDDEPTVRWSSDILYLYKKRFGKKGEC